MKQCAVLTLGELEDRVAASDIRLLKGLVLSTVRASSFRATTLTGILPLALPAGTFLQNGKLRLK